MQAPSPLPTDSALLRGFSDAPPPAPSGLDTCRIPGCRLTLRRSLASIPPATLGLSEGSSPLAKKSKKAKKPKASSAKASDPTKGSRADSRGSELAEAPELRQSQRARENLAALSSLLVFTFCIAFVFVRHHLIPYWAAREAEAMVRQKEASILAQFRQRAAQHDIEIEGWETQVFPRLIQVAYVYRQGPDRARKAFWWSYDPKKKELQRIKSLPDFVDNYLLPTVEDLRGEDIREFRGPFARVTHQEETY